MAQATAAAEGVTDAVAPKVVGEWFWRFLALVMLVVVAWVVWIAYQLNPTPLATPAAFEAAARARAAQSSPAPAAAASLSIPTAEGSPAAAEAGSSQPTASPASASVSQPVTAAAKEAPVQVEKLKLSDTLTTPPQDAKATPSAKPTP